MFETQDCRFWVNELQSIFGSIDDSQRHIDGVPGRFRWQQGALRFPGGRFNRHGSYALRVRHFVEMLSGEGS